MPFDTNLRNTLIFLAVFIVAFFPRYDYTTHACNCPNKTLTAIITAPSTCS